MVFHSSLKVFPSLFIMYISDLPLKAVVWGHSQFDHDGFDVSNWSSFEVHCQQLIKELGTILSTLLGPLLGGGAHA